MDCNCIGELDWKLSKSADDIFGDSFCFFIIIVLAFFPSRFVDFVFTIIDADFDGIGS